MYNKKSKRINNQRVNIFSGLGDFINMLQGNPNDEGILTTGIGKGLSESQIGGLSALVNTVGTLGGSLIGGGLSSGAGDGIQKIGSTIGAGLSVVNPLLGAAVSVGSNLLGGVTNSLFGSKLNKEKIANIEESNEALSNTIVTSGSNQNIIDQWNSQDWGDSFSRRDIGKEGIFSNKATNTYKRLKKEQEIARNKAYRSYDNAIDNSMITQGFNMLANYKDSGGTLFTNGGDWSNGLVFINNGGTHEENPMEGVQIGTDYNGTPNLVEEGEVVFNNYVFSNRLRVPNDIKQKYNLKGNKNLTFADAVKQLQKESEERPNDPISRRGLEDYMTKMQQAQEFVRVNKQMKSKGKKYSHGGKIGNLFSGEGENSNFLYGTLLDPINAEELWKAENNSNNSYKKSNLGWLRYAPVLGSAIGLGQNLISRPDYSSVDNVIKASNQVGDYTPVGFDPIGNYLQYKPLDRNFYINKLKSQAGATRSAILNTSSPSRNAALLAADYNAQGRLGDLARQAEEYNLAQRQAVESFNRGTNMANAEMGLKAAMANQEAALKARSSRLSGVAQAMAMKDTIDSRRGASISANLTNLFDSLGNIGVDEMNRADRDFYIKHVMGANLPLEEYRKLYGLDAAKKEAKKRGFTDNEITKFFKNGGQLKRRGGFTY